MPDVTDRDADAKLTAGGLGAGGAEHPSAQNAEFELADLAEQQTIVGVARIVDAILIDNACLDETAELEKMVPVEAYSPPEKGVPAVVDDAILPDMGRMNA